MEAAIPTVRELPSARPWRIRVAMLIVVILAAPALYLAGPSQGQVSPALADRSREEVEQRILAWIVERYPQANMRDFAEFPRALLEAAESAGLDYRIILAIADKESGFKPDTVGKAGEIGLMQLRPSTAEPVVNKLGMSWTPPVKDRSGAYSSLGSLADPSFNVRIGTTYLRWQIDRYGLNPVALRAYNRNPDRAKEHWPLDRYAEDVSMRYLVIAQALR
ncbi:MAG: transglycosylase SLT domain-containing protein [Candidatus Rokubacteria bacterium]|nr:transglycosylase SLT domain-containing protein [Candidatus Rokubacteria bacterium]